MDSKQRRAFTLVELLVVIAIIGILIALLLPAVQAAREAARRSQCTNNLKQIALALHNYHDSAKSFPASQYCNGDAINHCHTWMESLFPYLEQKPLFDQIDFSVLNHQGVNPSVLNGVVIEILMCPSDPGSGLYPNARETGYLPNDTSMTPNESLGANYIGCAGPVFMNECPVAQLNPNINCKTVRGSPRRLPRGNDDSPGMFSGSHKTYDFGFCQDGTSNTFLLGETLPLYNTFDMYFAPHAHIGSCNPPPNAHKLDYAPFNQCGPARDARIPAPPRCYAVMGGFKSWHPGGLQMALSDGAVRFVSELVDYRTWCFLGDKKDRQPVGTY